MISSNLAVSRSFGRSKSRTSSSSPLVYPSSSRPPRGGRSSGKRSASSSRFGGGKRFRGGKGSVPSKPSGFRKWEPSPCLTLSGGCLSLHWQAWKDRGAEPWVVEVLRVGYRIPFISHPPLSAEPIPMPCYNPLSTKGVTLEDVTLGLITKGAMELAPLPSPSFYSRLFVVWKTSRSWRPVIDLSALNRFVDVSHFRRRTFRFRFIRYLVPSFALCPMAECISSKRCASAYPRPRRFSLGSWLLFLPFSTHLVSACAGTSTTGLSSPPLRSLFSGISGWSWIFAASWGLWSSPRNPTSFLLRLSSISG